jgi:exopolysaccharide biosynthesis polyprenyl glycosylphosphotransferase
MVLPDIEYAKLGYSIQNFKGIPVLSINEPNAKSFGLMIKRLFDFILCSLGMLTISPILIAIALLVKLTSKGPIFYGQVRMGVDGKEFKMWKFRSMVIGEANQEGWTVKNDPRVTKIGNFIRKTSIDELPQLWNVVVGDMSLVGPRPERPVFVDKFRKEIPDYMLRHKFKAGITGWAQVNGWRGDTSIEKRIECDIWYIKNWSLWLDISIIFLTFWKGFINKNAY